jgi:cold shock CspA family protein
MSIKHSTATCQKCGSGFVLTKTYQDLIRRRGGKVIVPVLCPTCFLTEGPMPKQRGKIKWFNRHKHYGFIAAERGDEAFFHQTQLMTDDSAVPQEGQVVRFHLRYSVRGPEALNVEVVEA